MNHFSHPSHELTRLRVLDVCGSANLFAYVMEAWATVNLMNDLTGGGARPTTNENNSYP